MRYFDRNRRRLMKKHFVRGTLTKSNGENEVTIENSAGLPFEGITISGATHQNEYSGINLFDQELLISNNRFINSNYNGVECLKCSNSGLTKIPFEAPAGTYKFSFDIAHPSGYDCYSYITFEDGSKQAIFIYGIADTALSEFTRKTNTITAASGIVQLEIGIWNHAGKPFYLKDIMLCAGDETVYEPYVGGTYSPNPDYPQKIVNANSEGMSAVVHGYNLFNKDTVALNKSLNADTGTLFNSGVRGVSDFIKVDPSKQYTIYRPYKPPLTSQVRYSCCYDENLVYLGEPTKVSGIGSFGYQVYSFPPRTKYIRFNFWYDVENSINEVDGLIFYEGANELPYEPYWREKIVIPASVDVKGTTVHLRMAGLNDVTDKLVVDRINKRAHYIQALGQYEMTGDEETEPVHTNFFPQMPAVMFECFNAQPMLMPNSYTDILCNMLSNINTVDDTDNMCDVLGGKMFWIYIKKCSSAEEMRNIIRQKYEGGNPITFQYPLETPIEHDITDTDFSQALLNLVVPRTQSGVLRVESALPASGLEVEYYSMEKEDKVALEVLCVSEVGEELKRTSHSVRKDSKYQVKAPLIDGYTPINESIFGVASEEAEIIFEYKEA